MGDLEFLHNSSVVDKEGNIHHTFLQTSWYQEGERYDNFWVVENGKVVKIMVYDSEDDDFVGVDRELPPTENEMSILNPLIQEHDFRIVDFRLKSLKGLR